jgi:hypothetical protein
MSDKKKTDTPTCFNCGKTSEQAALFRTLINNTKRWVCARCLPSLIHGPH